jgi:signal transduction histidine kinase
VRFVATPVWQTYAWPIAAALTVLAVQSVMIVALIRQRRGRRVAEAASRSRLSEMAHMNRRVAMGELTASIAHEVNQPLAAIYSNAETAHIMLADAAPKLDQIAEILVDIKQDDKRASEVVSRIRAMLRKTEVVAAKVDLNETIAETIKLLAFDASSHSVSVRAELEPGLAPAHADRVQIQQVIVNLMLNAIEAMRDVSEASRRLLVRSRGRSDGEAEVSVSDSGAGILPELLPQLFDSFVTSKADGMGLGLSISRTIIESHRGRIWAENLPAGGAVFRFTLPLATR